MMMEQQYQVSYLVQTNCNNKANWMYPESAATFYTPYDQIIANNLSVEYSCVTIIRCRINYHSNEKPVQRVYGQT